MQRVTHFVRYGEFRLEVIGVVEQYERVDIRARGICTAALVLVLVNIDPAAFKTALHYPAVFLAERFYCFKYGLYCFVIRDNVLHIAYHRSVEVIVMQFIDPEKLFSFEAGDVRGDYYVWRRNGRSQLMAAHDVSNMAAVEEKAEESREFQQQKMAERSSRARVYKVRSGDTLSKIAKKYGLTVDRLCRLNNISKSKALKPGQILKCS